MLSDNNDIGNVALPTSSAGTIKASYETDALGKKQALDTNIGLVKQFVVNPKEKIPDGIITDSYISISNISNLVIKKRVTDINASQGRSDMY